MLAQLVRWQPVVALIAVAFAVSAIPAGGGVRGVSAAADHFPPNLADALTEIEYALDHEEDAGDALDEGGTAADDYAAGQIDDALIHLSRARAFLQRAVQAGEISAAEAGEIDALLREARGHDRDALATIDGAGTVRDTLDDLEDALEDKEDAGDWIFYGDQIEFGELGCVINVFPGFGGDTGVGFDGCDVAVVKLQLVPGFAFTRFSNGFVGSGNQLLLQFPCIAAIWLLTCTPPRALQPPSEYIYAYFGPFPSVLIANEALAYGSNGRVQRVEFMRGSVQATNLGVRTTLRDLTPYGLKAVPRSGMTARLGTGLAYLYQAMVDNNDDGAALNTKVTIDVPAGFTPSRVYPRSCTFRAGVVNCAFGTLEGGYSGLISVLGTPTKAGPLVFRSTVSSGAGEPSPDPNANTTSTAMKVYGVPRATITGIAAQVRRGLPGAFAGRAGPGATFEPPLERVTKVEVAVLRTAARAATAVPKTCLWLNKAGGFTKVPLHRGACDKGIWLRAKGIASWKYVLKKGLPMGTYGVYVRGTNRAGITGRRFSAQLKNAATFSVG
ncbi:MAG TPA: hypothetical protein VFR32_08390 [Gaiellaceae bacterium]|nr:hypothetical protein [Gaiellaceae bacterium]